MSGPNIKIYFFPWLEQWKSMKVIELLTLWCRKKKSIKQLLLYSCKSKHCIPMHTKAKDVQWSYSPTQARLYRLYWRYRPVCARLSQKSECRNKASCNFFADGGSCLEFIKMCYLWSAIKRSTLKWGMPQLFKSTHLRYDAKSHVMNVERAQLSMIVFPP